MSADVHDNHGQTPAAWTAVTIIMVAFCVGCLAVVLAMPWLFWTAVALVAVGAIVGKVMSMRGYGAQDADDSTAEQS
ncbi:MAG: hypothetical protein E6Q90_11915 [Actinobacteria bacterium]|nr:MAG: hypothetical protein E6Q90_11915 [Actinomycetota bacterium]